MTAIRSFCRLLEGFLVPSLFLAGIPAGASVVQGDLTIFATGFSVPESITPVSSGFGLSGGGYIIPDPTVNRTGIPEIYTLPLTGGTPTSLAVSNFFPLGGVILPSGYSAAGDYLAVGFVTSPAVNGFASTVDSSGNITPVVSNSGSAFTSAVVAPSGFGSAGGEVLIADENTSNIYVLAPDGSTSILTNIGSAIPGGEPFGLAFAPAGFGSIGGDLLASDSTNGKIFAIDSSGNVSLFTTIPLGTGQPGLRQMAIAPSGYGNYGGDLFVSVSGSTAGGGTFGSVVAVNASGGEDAIIDQGSLPNAFDPRGLYFPNSSELLIADSDPIHIAKPNNFNPVPEPGYYWLFGMAAIGLIVVRRQKAMAR